MWDKEYLNKYQLLLLMTVKLLYQLIVWCIVMVGMEQDQRTAQAIEAGTAAQILTAIATLSRNMEATATEMTATRAGMMALAADHSAKIEVLHEQVMGVAQAQALSAAEAIKERVDRDNRFADIE